jgi:hypothetical protein
MSTDEAILESWSILKDYGYNREELLAVAGGVHRALRQLAEPAPQEMEPLLIEALLVSRVFRTICASKRHANPALYSVFARALARYMLQQEWSTLTTNR